MNELSQAYGFAERVFSVWVAVYLLYRISGELRSVERVLWLIYASVRGESAEDLRRDLDALTSR